VTIVQGWVSTTSATRPTPPVQGFLQQQVNYSGANQHAINTGQTRVSLATTAITYLSARASFTGSLSVYGLVRARRVR
jgi:hypothetical protein